MPVARSLREAVKKLMEGGKLNDYIHLIRHRAKQCLRVLREDLELLEKVAPYAAHTCFRTFSCRDFLELF